MILLRNQPLPALYDQRIKIIILILIVYIDLEDFMSRFQNFIDFTDHKD